MAVPQTSERYFWVPASDEAPGRRIGAKAVLPGFVHPTWPDHGWGSLVRPTISAKAASHGRALPRPRARLLLLFG